MSLLSKDEILKSQDSKFVELEVPEWGGSVRLATMSGFARDRFETSVVGKNNMNTSNIRAKFVAACLVDENGNLLFNESEIEALGKKSSVALDKVFGAAQKLNGIGQTEVEELAKN
jgi:hypothetical protein